MYIPLLSINFTNHHIPYSLSPTVPAMDTPRTMWQLNHINFKLPPFPLLTQPEMIPPNQFCNVSTAGNCTKEYCSCTHMLSAKLGGVVELVIVDEGFIYIISTCLSRKKLRIYCQHLCKKWKRKRKIFLILRHHPHKPPGAPARLPLPSGGDGEVRQDCDRRGGQEARPRRQDPA